MYRWESETLITESKGITFDDITLVPADFSEVRSRKDVNPYHPVVGQERLGIISSNMDSVFSPELAKEVVRNGGISCMHRFCTIQENVKMFQDSGASPYVWGSVGCGKPELERAVALYNAGVKVLVLDVAHGAAIHVVDQFKALKDALPLVKLVVGNFDNSRQIHEFVKRAGHLPDAFKVGIGPGSACITRTTTGVGTPSVTCLQDCVTTGYPVIFDGGIKTSGDFSKAMALGATAVFMGRNFAACEESGSEKIGEIGWNVTRLAKYRGSASQSSYVTQGKTDRTPEGGEYYIPVSGSVEQLMKNYEGGLRSSMSYLGAFSITSYRKNAKILVVSTSSFIESGLHGDKQ